MRLAAAAAMLLAPAGAAFAAQVIVVIDGSGSSAGQIGGVAKIDIARGALASILADSPSDLSIGLVAYGHRQRENCGDIELVARPGSPEAFVGAAARVQSVGRSPIADATAAAADALTEDEATIIVITDNSDNCSPNPCATISALKDERPGLTISVVGIAIPQDEVGEIACFAELTGGVYLRAESAAAFEASLAEAMELAWADPGPPPPPMPTAVIEFPENVVKGQVFSVAYQGPDAPGDEIRIAWAGTPPDDFITGAAVHSDGTPVQLVAPNVLGAFELRYWHAERSALLARIPLRLQPLVPSLSAPPVVQQGADVRVAWLAEAQGGEIIEIVPVPPLEAARSAAPLVRGEPAVILPAPAVPGEYAIRLVTGPDHGEPPMPGGGVVLAETTIEIVAAEITMEAAGPIVTGRSFAVGWTGPGGAADEIRLAAPDAAAGEFLDMAAPFGDAVRLTAPGAPGRYELRYWSAAAGDVLATVPIEIGAASASLEAPAEVMGGATFEVVWTGDAAVGDRLAIVDVTGVTIATERVSLFGRPNLIDAPVAPGTYELAYVAGGGETLATHAITVTAPAVTLAAPDEAGVGEAIEVVWTGPGGRFDEVRLVDGEGAVVAATRARDDRVTLTAPAEPGDYRIQYWAGGADAVLATIDIRLTCPDCAPIAPEPAAGAAPGPAPAAVSG